MDEVQNSSDQVNADEVMGSLGVEPEAGSTEEPETGSMAKEDDPVSVKKRLGMQAKRHQREMRAMQERMDQMQAQMGQQQNQPNQPEANPYAPQQAGGMSIEEQIQRGVRYALQAKDQEEQKAKEAERMQHVHKQYQRLNGEFDKASEKYDDFDDVVRGDDAPFTPAVRDALLLIDNPADVAYKLGKNRDELNRIAKLHPLDQAREVNKLSFALMGGNTKASNAPRSGDAVSMSNIKANPAISRTVTDKTPAADIRARMKAGTWK